MYFCCGLCCGLWVQSRGCGAGAGRVRAEARRVRGGGGLIFKIVGGWGGGAGLKAAGAGRVRTESLSPRRPLAAFMFIEIRMRSQPSITISTLFICMSPEV